MQLPGAANKGQGCSGEPYSCVWCCLCLSLPLQGFVEYLGVDLGELFAPAGLLPSDFLYDEGNKEDDTLLGQRCNFAMCMASACVVLQPLQSA